jgi:uroporphyrinogen III methyltransferase/synthase
VGAGPGDPGLITVRGLRALRRADVVVYDRLVSPALVGEAPRRARRVFVGKAAGHHGARQEDIHALVIGEARRGRRVVRLKGGDPFVFGRGGEEALALTRAGIPFEVVPGVTAAVAAPAAAGIPLTHRGLASSFAVVTGHADPATGEPAVDWSRLAGAADTLVILMVGRTLPATVRALTAHGRSPATPVALVSCGTTPAQRVLVGTLGDIVARAAAGPLPAPVLAVVGEAVGLRRHLAPRRDGAGRRDAGPVRATVAGTAPRRSAGTPAPCPGGPPGAPPRRPGPGGRRRRAPPG